MAGVVEGIGQDGEDDAAVGATDEIEAAFLLDELELRRQVGFVRGGRVVEQRARMRAGALSRPP